MLTYRSNDFRAAAIVQQLAAQIPRFHNCALLDKVPDEKEIEAELRDK